MNYSISEISKKYEVNNSTLRYYEDMGLLEDVEHNKLGKRIYNDSHLERLDGIMCFKRAGMSISQIKQYYDLEKHMDKNIDAILELIGGQKSYMIEEMEELQKALNHIDEKLYYYGLVKNAIDNGSKIPTWDEIFNKGEE